jgi:hypothetical protein
VSRYLTLAHLQELAHQFAGGEEDEVNASVDDDGPANQEPPDGEPVSAAALLGRWLMPDEPQQPSTMRQ